MTESRQSKTPGGSCPSSSQIAGSHVLPLNVLFVFWFASVIVGCAGSVFQTPSTTNLYWIGLSYGIVMSTDQTDPWPPAEGSFVIGTPVSQVPGPPKSPRSSTADSLPAGYVIVCAQR